LAAAELFLTKTPPERQTLVRLAIEDRLREVVAQLAVDEIVAGRNALGGRLQSEIEQATAKLGLEVVSITIRGGPDVSNDPRLRSERPAAASATSTYSRFAASVTDGAG
jgi:uncharacterized membrane protein YqiK